jgi:hypothetical protein
MAGAERQPTPNWNDPDYLIAGPSGAVAYQASVGRGIRSATVLRKAKRAASTGDNAASQAGPLPTTDALASGRVCCNGPVSARTASSYCGPAP